MSSSPALASLPAIRRLGGVAREQAVRQDAVATTGQLVAWGFTEATISRRVTGGQWQRVFPGVMALQSGPISWRQRARAALLYAGPGAALSHRSAAYVRDVVPAPGATIEVTVPHARTVRPQRGLVVHRRRHMPWAGGRLRCVEADDAVLSLVARARTTDEVVGLLCDAVRAGVAPELLLARAGQRMCLRNRALLTAMIGEVTDGIESPLELRYRRDVERAHGLPRAAAQVRQQIGGRWIRADRVYRGYGVRVELDGELAHPFGTTDDDVWRDNAVLIATGDITLRFRWRHVVVTPCEAAVQVIQALRARGWRGTPHPCGPGCPVGRVGWTSLQSA